MPSRGNSGGPEDRISKTRTALPERQAAASRNQHQPSSTAKPFNDRDTSDCVVESWGKRFYVHQSTLSKSPYFRNAFKAPWKESSTRKLQLNVETPQIVEASLYHLYNLQISPPNDSNDATFYADVFALAEYLDLPSLKKKMAEAFAWALQNQNGFRSAMESAQSVFEKTPSDHRELRDLTLACFDAQRGINKILHQPGEAYELIEKAPQLAAELLFRGLKLELPRRQNETPYYTQPRQANGRARSLPHYSQPQLSSQTHPQNDPQSHQPAAPNAGGTFDHACHCSSCGTSFGATNLPSGSQAFIQEGGPSMFCGGFQNPYALAHGRASRYTGAPHAALGLVYCPGCGTPGDLDSLEAKYRNRYTGFAAGTTARRPGATMRMDWGNLIG